ncbi:MAG: hypothetical protein IH950_11740 [Bacteroidetes bacterium]|nr:hypothetical protein [Bacteroidota bacterium]
MITNKLNIMRYLSVMSVLLLLVMSVTGCNDEAAPTENSSTATLFKVIHHVSLGGADACEAFGLPPGCDGNFSLVANMKANGNITGQWQDTFAGGGEGIHVAIDCMKIIGNGAIVGGVITHGTAGGVDVSGQYAITAVVDNGTSSNDPPDQISFSFIDPANSILGTDDCNELTLDAFPLLDLTTGQVKVR